jgi:uncharacterized membrane protein YjdF
MHPDWLGSPQHFVAGLVLAFAIALVAGRRGIGPYWLIAVLAVAVTMLAESAVELVEYPLLYSDRFHATAYYDTIADIASTLVGALVAVVASRLFHDRFTTG